MYRQLLLIVLGSCFAGASQSEVGSGERPNSATYARVYCGPDNQTHLAKAHIDFVVKDYAPPARPSGVSKSMGADSVTFLSLPVGYVGDWHPAPRRQFIISLSGETEIEVGDGAVQRLRAGDVVLVEDTDCAGHVTKAVGDAPAIGIAIPLTGE